MGASDYIQSLYANDLDGYIQIMSTTKDGRQQFFNARAEQLKHLVGKQEGKQDIYITPNSFYIPRRNNDNIRQFRALFIDLDIDKYSKSETYYQISIMASDGKIPRPSLVVDSGRGLHLYWIIEHAPKGAAWTWQELEDFLYKHLKHLGADLRATDAARLLRLPGTINSRNNQECKVLEANSIKYSMYELRADYLKYGQTKSKPSQSHTEVRNNNVKSFMDKKKNSYTLHLTRAQDIETLARLREYNMKGYRDAALHCYIYWKGIYNRELESLIDIGMDLNNKFTEPEKPNVIKSIAKSTLRAIDKFIEYEQGLNAGESKRVTKGMRDKAGYWYTNDRLIEMLDITPQEQMHLKTIISKDEKNRRRRIADRKSRRNHNGLTSREQSKADNIAEAKALIQEGYTQSQAAEIMGVTQGYISQILKTI